MDTTRHGERNRRKSNTFKRYSKTLFTAAWFAKRPRSEESWPMNQFKTGEINHQLNPGDYIGKHLCWWALGRPVNARFLWRNSLHVRQLLESGGVGGLITALGTCTLTWCYVTDLKSQMCPAIEMCYVTLWGWGSKVHLNLSNWSYARDDEQKVPKTSLGDCFWCAFTRRPGVAGWWFRKQYKEISLLGLHWLQDLGILCRLTEFCVVCGTALGMEASLTSPAGFTKNTPDFYRCYIHLKSM